MILIKIFKCVIHKQSTKILKRAYPATIFNKYNHVINKITYITKKWGISCLIYPILKIFKLLYYLGISKVSGNSLNKMP